MARAIEIIDPEGEKAKVRRRRIAIAAVFVGLALLVYPELRDFSTKWHALKAGHRLAMFLSTLKTQAILEKTAYEARFTGADAVEVFRVSSCGPNAQRTKVSDLKLSEPDANVVFLSESWIRQNVDTNDPVLPRFCYDPMFGSSLLADGLSFGGVFLAHEADMRTDRGDHVIELVIEGTSGGLSIEYTL